MSTLTRSAHGLDGGNDFGWWRLAACRDRNPDWWTTAGNLTVRNREALRLCSQVCPVREACRDDALNAPRRPTAQIVGGWVWNADGDPAPYPGEEHLVPKRAPAPVTANGGARPRAENVDVLFAAAQAYKRDELTIEEAIAQAGKAKTVVRAAISVVRHTPELVDEVLAERMSLSAAVQAAGAVATQKRRAGIR